MKLNHILSAALAGTMCLCLAACGSQPAPESGSGDTPEALSCVVLTESWDFSSGFYPVLSPATASNYGAAYWNHNFYDTLVTYTSDGELVGSLAETWEVTDGGKTYTFHLRPGVLFSDGTPLTAEAVRQSYEAAILNLGGFNGSYGKLTTVIESMEAPDDSTFVLHLSAPYYGALNDMTMCNPLAIVNPAAFEGGAETAYANVLECSMGTGPYMYAGEFDGTTYTFVRNPNYWGEAPEADSFQVKVIEDNDAKVLALRSGEIDAIVGSSRMNYDAFSELSGDAAWGTALTPNSTRTRYLGLNLSVAPFDDPLVREALAYAVDQQALEISVFNGIETAAEKLFPNDKPYCDVDSQSYDTDAEKAKELLEQAGWVDTDGDGVREKDGVPLQITLKYSQSLASIDNAVLAIASQMKLAGFGVDISGTDMMTWYGEVVSGDYTAVLWYTLGSSFDPTATMTNMNPAYSADPIAAQFGLQMNDPAILDELDSTADENRVAEIYAEVLQTLAEKNLLVPVTYAHEMAVFNQELISGCDFEYDAEYVNVANIHLK